MTKSTRSPVDERERIVAEFTRRSTKIPADYYALDRPANRFLYQRYTATARAMLEGCSLPPMSEANVLEVGCGDAQWLVELRAWGASPANLHGIDLDAAHIERARARQPGIDLRVGDACSLPWADGEFDLVIQSTVFTSILSGEMRKDVAREIVRVLKPNGVVLWYDFVYDNPTNRNVRGIRVREVQKLFPGLVVNFRRVTLAPPLARLVVPLSETLARSLYSIPFLRTHIIATLRRLPEGTGR